MKRLSFSLAVALVLVLSAVGFGAPQNGATPYGGRAGHGFIVPLTAEAMAADAAAGSGVCGTSTHCTSLTWTEATPAPTGCTIGYNVFEGTTSGGESTTPINSALLQGTSDVVPATLTGVPQTFYFEVAAVETCGTVAQSSGNSNEVSATFPGIPANPAVSVTVQ